MTGNDRWVVALHEAGHATAAIVLGGSCNGLIITSGGGFCITHGLSGDRQAFMTAAGPTAERLAIDHEPPTDCHITLPEHLTTMPTVDDNEILSVVSNLATSGLQAALSDSGHIVRWAINADPENWNSRIQFAHHIANQIIKSNTKQIVAIARRLFVAGRLTKEEITSTLESIKKEPQ